MNKTALLTTMMGLGLPALSQPVPALVAKADCEAGAILEAVRLKGEAVVSARAEFLESGKPAQEFKADVDSDLQALTASLARETRPDVRQTLIVGLLYLRRLNRETPSAQLLDLTFAEVPPLHRGWGLDKGLMLALATWAPQRAEAYLAQARAAHPDGALRCNLLFDHFMDLIDTRTESEWRPSYDALQKAFPGSREAKRAADRLASESKTAVGKLAPAFEVPALDDSAVHFTPGTFKGHFVLLDFWASWCPDCAAEMPSVHAAYSQFKGQGLEILSLSLDRKVEAIAPYRKRPATPMPWKHAFLAGGFKNPLCETYGVLSIPKAVLVGPDGKIVAQGSELRGAQLAKTLEKFLPKS